MILEENILKKYSNTKVFYVHDHRLKKKLHGRKTRLHVPRFQILLKKVEEFASSCEKNRSLDFNQGAIKLNSFLVVCQVCEFDMTCPFKF